jgi:hypothetical protein
VSTKILSKGLHDVFQLKLNYKRMSPESFVQYVKRGAELLKEMVEHCIAVGRPAGRERHVIWRTNYAVSGFYDKCS